MPSKVFEIPGKLSVEWETDVKAIVDTWTNYTVTLEQFKDAVLGKGVSYASGKGVKAWIVDSSQANGAFSQEIQQFIGSTVFPKFAEIGVKYFITITSSVSAVTKMTVKSYSAKTGPNGLKLVEANSRADAIAWLKENK
ncbi:hypothetical protein KKF34_01530 [Myxococcota bacterium]|nr:hypothetical protein [Myxococcota bacterium]MBU1380081.1 hypothetical protein [Myxococcota bacterium]MBU1495539.1 hypothetical protein [Myxococcota bacterium]